MDWQCIHNMACMLLAQGWGGRLVGGGGEGDRKGASRWLRPAPPSLVLLLLLPLSFLLHASKMQQGRATQQTQPRRGTAGGPTSTTAPA